MSEDMDAEQAVIESFFKSNVTHVVIEFLHEKTINNKASIELVPREWLDHIDEKWICYYPPSKDWPKVDKWTRISKCRERLWKGSEVRILKEATNYEKGIRRLQRFFTNEEVASTGEDVREETETQSNKVKILSVSETLAELQSLPPMVPNEVAASTGAIVQKLSTVERNRSMSIPMLSVAYPEKRDEPKEMRKHVGYHNETIEPVHNTVAKIISADGIDYDRFLLAVASLIQVSEKRILREINGAKRSILYDVQIRVEEVKNTVMVNSVSSQSTDISQNIESLGFTLPFNTVEDFETFDIVIATGGEKRKSLECIMKKYTIGNNEFNAGLSRILSSLLGKEVQLQYSACGREVHGKKKKNFSETQTFKYMDAVLTEKYSVSTKTITTKTSRWFIGAGDRAGGRKERK